MKQDLLRLLLIVACFSLVLALKANSRMADTQSPIFHESSDYTKLTGIWRSRGYGWVWSIKNGKIRGYDATENYCIASPYAVVELGEPFQINNTGQTIRVSFDDPTYKYTFDKIDSLPESCSEARDKSAISVLDALNEIFATHYAFFTARNIDWTRLVSEARKKITAHTSEEDLFTILRTLLSHIEDDHVSLVVEIGGREIVHSSGPGKTLLELAAQSKRTGIEFNVLLERWKRNVWTKELRRTLFGNTGHDAAGGLINYGRIDGDIGLLTITAMEEFASIESEEHAALDEALDDAMTLFQGATAVIVDVSINDGGYDRLARHIAERFTTKRTLAYSKYAGDAPADQPQKIYLEPTGKKQFTGPVYLLTSDVTVSAAEILVMCMRALPNVTHVGHKTRGSLSDALWKRLPNKWGVSLSNEVYLDAEGLKWEGKGIPPQIQIQVFSGDNPSSSLASAIQSIVSMVGSQKRM